MNQKKKKINSGNRYTKKYIKKKNYNEFRYEKKN